MKLTELLDHSFMGTDNFVRAITHRSASAKHNERLEFLGDSILGVVITIALYKELPKAQEGHLSRLRASLVNSGTLADIAREISLGDFLKLGPGELRSGGFRRNSILADTLEAVIASIYLENGMEAASNFILEIFEERLLVKNLPSEHDLKDPKSRLQEILQSRSYPIPKYNLLNVSGDAHKQVFMAECIVPSLDVHTKASARSRRKAEQEAAELAYVQVKKLLKL